MSSETFERDSKKNRLLGAPPMNHRDDDDDDQDAREARNGSSGRVSSPPTGDKRVMDRPSSFHTVMTIARREISAYFHSPITYIVIPVSLVGLGLWFFFYKGGFWQVDRATMTRLFDAAPVLLCALTIPLFTMRALSDEKRVGTIELLITMPVKDSEVILGKYVGALSVVAVQLGLMALYPVVIFWRAPFWHLGDLDWNPFWVGMMGLFLLSMAGTAIGLMWSSFTESQILSYFATAVTLAALYGIGQVSIVEFLQGWPGDAISFVSLQTRFDPFARGLIDTRAIVYFLSLTVLSLLVAFRSLESRKWT